MLAAKPGPQQLCFAAVVTCCCRCCFPICCRSFTPVVRRLPRLLLLLLLPGFVLLHRTTGALPLPLLTLPLRLRELLHERAIIVEGVDAASNRLQRLNHLGKEYSSSSSSSSRRRSLEAVTCLDCWKLCSTPACIFYNQQMITAAARQA
jgi:hypothetical protein